MSADRIETQSVGERVRMLRKKLGLHQDKFALPLGVKKSHISLIECGKRGLKKPLIKLLGEIYKANPEWIQTGEGEMFFQDPGTSAAGPLDTGILRSIIEGVERGTLEQKKELTPSKKADLILLLYEYFTEVEKAVSQHTIDRYLKLL
jgi:transcriptional regulator with XRE-family HTH domain